MTADELIERLRRLGGRDPARLERCDALCQRTRGRDEGLPVCGACGRRHVEPEPEPS